MFPAFPAALVELADLAVAEEAVDRAEVALVEDPAVVVEAGHLAEAAVVAAALRDRMVCRGD
jgi:hypothetical protein